MELNLSERELQPELISCRHFDSRQFHRTEGKRTKVRTAHSYEFSIFLSEGGTLCLPDGDHPIHPGFCRFILPGTQLCSIPHYESLSVCFSLAPDQNGQVPICRNAILDSIPICFTSRMPERYEQLMKELEALSFQTEPGTILACRQKLLELLLLIHRDVTGATTVSAADRAVELVRNHLRQHQEEEVSLEDLGELTGYHPLYLQRIFRQATGSTPHGFLTQLRLTRAKELLSTTDLPISQIAMQCGYSSVSHFTSLFRKAVGFPPITFRKRARIPG